MSRLLVLSCVGSLLLALSWAGPSSAAGEEMEDWRASSQVSEDGLDWTLYVEAEATPGRPAFRIETNYPVEPAAAAAVLMKNMSAEAEERGQTRRLLERTERSALVHTFIDLPLMFSDREVAIRIQHQDDRETGIHRIEWVDTNDVLPAPKRGVMRLATKGYWEFRPAGPGRTAATYVSRAEVGGSLPRAFGDRIMRSQAEDAVRRLAGLVADQALPNVASPPPE